MISIPFVFPKLGGEHININFSAFKSAFHLIKLPPACTYNYNIVKCMRRPTSVGGVKLIYGDKIKVV